ncbi:hypothetical protein UWK_02752 [Desulfocapsa sulfexigens DSM 10523]|uniref:Uncharacterized protein n=1 Tax=Desulfocapsa sulfexigens (strain DSM 10523 / SB164P1) TaxID=1167006 RepID=M1PCD9_DESSD|nr:hypothetical protein [Desulfocapsa sulfexigens]AGF79287.1 hypothetical protein UWK_02752 [Desulfocapsa sulfexigens DSM 10523]
MKRCTVLKGGLAAISLVGAAGSTTLLQKVFAGRFSLPLLIQPVIAANASRSRIGECFSTPLPIPPLLKYLDNTLYSTRFSMNMQQEKVKFFRDKPTDTMGYNGN